MTSQMEWSHDFCLTCDRQIPEGTYCSQACRLAELEKAGRNETSTSTLSSSASSSNSSSHGFYLPPAYNFSAVKAPSPSRGFDVASSPHYYANAHNYFATSPTTAQSQQRSLTPSSSRSSLQSTASQSSSGISLQAAYQLNGYVRSFDQVRETKRRHTHPHC
jgi:predicted nucleic acid-binding Zn ribbon protein